MAKNKKHNTNPHLNGLSDIKRKLIIGVWAITIVVIAAVLSKHVATKELQNSDIITANTPAESLLTLILPHDLPNKTIEYAGHTVYFNTKLRVPNATIYHLTAEETLGNLPRVNDFLKDENVPSCPNSWDYSRSGYDRGHMTPAGDMKWDKTAMQQTFLMTNICPQDHAMNSGIWSKIENKIRDWARRDSALIVATGPIFEGSTKTIGKANIKIAVPSAFFKVVFCPEQQRMVAFIVPNSPDASYKVRKHLVSVDDVEQRTGIDFFAALDDNNENLLESTINYEIWETHR